MLFLNIELTADDVPGAKLLNKYIEAHNISQLGQFLKCIGLNTTGLNEALCTYFNAYLWGS